MKKKAIALLFIIVLLCGQTIKLGILESDQNLVHICQVAVKDAQDADQCTSQPIQDHLLRFPALKAFVNPACDDEMLEIARLAYFWNSPVMIRVAMNPSITNQEMYPTVVQFALTSAVGYTYAIKHLADYLNITSAVLVSSDQRDYDHYPVVAGIRYVMREKKLLRIEKYVKIDEFAWRDKEVTAQTLKTSSQMIIIGYDFEKLEMVLRELKVTSLSSNGYMVVLVCNQVSETCTSAVKNLIASAKIVVLAPTIDNYEVIINVLSKRMNLAVKPVEVEQYLVTYDACYGFCFGTRRASPVDGLAFAQSMRNQQFNDVFGNVTLDGAARRLQNYAFQWLPSKNDEYRTAMTLSMVRAPCVGEEKCFSLETHVTDEEFWAEYENITIKECVYKGGCQNYLLIVVGSVAGVGLVLGAIGLYLYRRKKHMDVYRLTWKVSKENLKVIETKQSKGRAVSDNLSNKRRFLDSYALVGTSKAEFMCFKQQKRIPWSKVQLKFLYELKSLNHDNLTNFIGVCYNDLDRFYVLHALIERASLEDFIYDHDFNMDNTFKSAFIKDILKGLQYLHKSPIGYHGMLSLKTCLIDANWVLKMTHFGISSLLNQLIEQNFLRAMELIPQQFYITVAPELLSGVQIGRNYPKGTVAGDVYSFGMMLYSIIHRTGPFDRMELSLKEVFENVIQKSLRPQVDNTDNDPLIALMCQCWNSTPEARPKLRNIHQTIGTIFSSSKGNLVDQMIKMNEKYAQNLERIVAERTSLLVEAQEQTDRLLCEMLPPSIAAQLKAGEPIIPRSYESVTVGFCQIVDFGHLMAQCTAEQVIAFLNDAFMTFDEVIGRHDAYKVETTGETYMVASGVPSENEGRHIFEVAEIALEIRERTLTYKVAAAPDWQLRVRIGFHCGPIAAGVIGLRSPRYCLFGDTVNFASRMQSNCQANQIQMAESTAKILMESSKYRLTKRGIVHVKGKGDVNTYWLNEHIVEVLEPVKTPVANTAMPDLIQTLSIKTSATTNSTNELTVTNPRKASRITVQVDE